MAEIKSTMEMVLARAARIAAIAGPATSAEDTIKDGMRLAAGFLRGEAGDLFQKLTGRPAPVQPALRQGMATTLLRNILLPREDDQLDLAEKAMRGLMQLGDNDRGLLDLCRETTTILEQYQQHGKQLRAQLEQSFTQQLEASQARQPGPARKIDPTRHPKFQEEWLNLKLQLDDQYSKVLDQQKGLIKQRFAL
ncbi:MAG: hypothetical protein COZ12_03795 [Deltaproteobacteria bacterium CG_4_10_14_3_um_filter_60_8]|nr:MAG: hypothetical protein AUK28_11445 [Desulfobacterales bacterium CG2_30_60_27]PIP43213.1 MAG: hypothetical protein COX17_08310 [Deltaproteobacteria bacterium CG23_combo_of_CG06-09_8_20_14_all_60_8]PIY21950.1 MAG: hypothetical protein COZ12_03795 [Deltaproteobacteria bacterium CG_4_10_14_3_um_filter_60_8]